MDKILPFLETYKGRDKILRLLCYSSKYFAGSIKSPELAAQFDKFSTQLSTSRACFRLLDDVPTVADIWTGLDGKKDHKSFTENTVDTLEMIVDLIFCPLDHISWAMDHQILTWKSPMWDIAGTLCWVISLYISIYKTVMKMVAISSEKMRMKSMSSHSESIKKLSAQQYKLQLTAMKCIADLLFAVNYLPKGVLWGKFFTKKGVGLLGTISSIVSLYQALLI